MNVTPNKQSNTLGNANLVLGILVLSLVFRISLSALVGIGKGCSTRGAHTPPPSLGCCWDWAA